ncbi:MAG: PAS domain S-box protein [Methanobacteriaceae archaeon]|jgi:PAS domain S-box-containing protein|nr:PAS domain S-box protein [Methanobacteriaceae archaeon]MDO9627806.1 PAS domain S-box protein [Methanobacteriaceae archaeon]
MSPFKILLVEDDAIESLDIQKRLEILGYEVPYVASRGQEAIDKASEIMPDLVLMDITLKGDMNGIEAASKIIKLNIPIIYLTAHSDEATVKKAKHTQPYGYLIKPYDPNELKYALELAIYKSKNDKKLKESYAISKALLNSSNYSVFLTDNKGIFLDVNESTALRLGFDKIQLIGSHFKEFINPKLAKSRWKHFENVIKTKKPVEFEDERDGIIFEHRIIPILENGEVKKLASFSRDITDKKIAEQTIIESGKRYKTIFDNSGSSSILFDKSGLILMVNSEWENVSGYSKEEVEGKMNWMELVHPDYLDLMMKYHQKRESGDSSIPSKYETRFIKKNGSPLNMYVSIAPMVGKKEWIASSIDITDLKKTQEKLSQNEERLNLAMQGANAALFDWNISTGAAYFSPEYYQMFGYEPGESPATYESWIKIIHPEDREKTISNLNQQFKDKLDQFKIEYRAICKDSTEKWILGLAKGNEFDENGMATRIIGINLDMSEQKELEKNLSDSQRTLKTLMSNLPGMAYRCKNDPQWTIEFVSEGCLELTGYTSEDLNENKKLSFASLIHPDDREKVWEEVQKALAEKKHFKIPYRIITSDSITKYVLEKGKGIFSGKGELLALEGFISDISEQKIAEEKLTESENYLYKIINTIPDPVFVKNRNHEWELVNTAFCEFIGHSNEELVGKSDYDFFPEHEADVFWEKDEEVFITKKENVNEEKITTYSGHTHTIITKKTVYNDKTGADHLVGVIRDVTDLKNVQKSLKKQYNFLQNLMDSIPNPIFYKDVNYKYRGCNTAFEEVLGKSKKSIIGKTVYDLNPPELSDKFHEKDQKLFENPGAQRYESPVKYADGTIHEILFVKNTYNDPNGNLAGMIGVMSDITEIRNAEKALKISEREYREVFENMDTALAVYEALHDGEDFIIKDFNLAGAKIEQVSRKEVIGKKITEAFPGVIEFGLFDVFKRVWKTGTPERFPISFYKDERISGWRENYVYKLASGEVVAVYDDLTEKKQAEEEIILNQNRLKSLVKILQYNPESVQELLDYALREAIELTKSKIGYIYHYYPDKEEFILNTWSKGVMEECSVEKAPAIYKLEKTGIWGEAVRQKKSFIINDFQSHHPLKKGYPEGHAPLYKYMTLPVFSRNEIVAVVGVANKEEDYNATDLLQLELLMDAVWKGVDRQKFEEALQISEIQYKSIFENTGTATAISEEDMVLSLVNEEFCELSGYSKEEIENKLTWTEFFVEDQLELMKKYHRLRRIDPKKAPKNYESQLIDREGNIKDAYMSVAMIPGTKKSLVSVLDITEKKRSRTNLKKELKINQSLAHIYSPIISPDSSIEDVASVILKESKELTGSLQGYVSSIDPKTGYNIIHTLTKMMPNCKVLVEEERLEFPKGADGKYNGLWGYSLNIGNSFFTNSPQEHESSAGIPEGHIKLENFLSVPIFSEKKLVGQIALANSPRDYSKKDIDAITRIGEFYALAIHSKEADKEIRNSLEEKDTLLREIHHRVKNNMQIISSLLNLQKYWDSDVDPLELIEDSQNRIRTMSIVHELLYQSENLSKVDLKVYIQKLTNYLFEQYSARSRKITLWTDLEEGYLNIETSVPCCLIVNELVSNSLKHAFQSGDGEIQILFHKLNEKYELIVKDNGIGLPKDFDLEKSHTLGLFLVKSLIDQIDGVLEVKNDNGVEFKIVFEELIYKKRF